MSLLQSFLLTDNTPLHGQTTFYASVNGYLGCFHFWPIANNTALDMFSFLLGADLGGELLGYIMMLCLTF